MNENLPTTIDYSDDKTVAVLKQTVAKGATDSEFAMFAEFCKSTKLNPFKKEIWFIKTAQGVQMMTGVNGFYEIANRHPQFDGIEIETVEDGAKLIKCIAKVYRKDRSRPMTAEAYFSEYNKNFGNWKTMPRVMLSKCAECMALRKAFPQELNGLYSVEEMPREFSQPVLSPSPSSPSPVTLVTFTKAEEPAPEPEPTTPGDHRITGNGSGKLKSIGQRVRDLPREALLLAVQDKKVTSRLSESDVDAIIAYLGETDTAPEVQVPIEEDDIPNFDQREAA